MVAGVFADQHVAICQDGDVVRIGDAVGGTGVGRVVLVIGASGDDRGHLLNIEVVVQFHLVDHAALVFANLDVALVVGHALGDFGHRHVHEGNRAVGSGNLVDLHAFHLAEFGSGALGSSGAAAFKEGNPVVVGFALGPGCDLGIGDVGRLAGLVIVLGNAVILGDPARDFIVGGMGQFDPGNLEGSLGGFRSGGRHLRDLCSVKRAGAQVARLVGNELVEDHVGAVVGHVDRFLVRHDDGVFVAVAAQCHLLDRDGAAGRVLDFDDVAVVIRVRIFALVVGQGIDAVDVFVIRIVPVGSVVEIKLFRCQRGVPRADAARAVDPGAADGREIDHPDVVLVDGPRPVRSAGQLGAGHATRAVFPVGEEITFVLSGPDEAVEVRIVRRLDDTAGALDLADHVKVAFLEKDLVGAERGLHDRLVIAFGKRGYLAGEIGIRDDTDRCLREIGLQVVRRVLDVEEQIAAFEVHPGNLGAERNGNDAGERPGKGGRGEAGRGGQGYGKGLDFHRCWLPVRWLFNRARALEARK